MALIRLCDHDSMLMRLRTVVDNEYVQERLFPSLLDHAGQQKSPAGLVMAIVLALDAAQAGLPVDLQKTLTLLGPDLIKALVDDEAFVAEALRHWNVATTK